MAAVTELRRKLELQKSSIRDLRESVSEQQVRGWVLKRRIDKETNKFISLKLEQRAQTMAPQTRESFHRLVGELLAEIQTLEQEIGKGEKRNGRVDSAVSRLHRGVKGTWERLADI